jgi:hypothetical protein
VTNAEFCFDIGKQRRDFGIELPSNVRRGRLNLAKRWIILVQKLVIKPVAKNPSRSPLNFADVDQHARGWIDGPSENKICDVVSAAAIPRVCLRAEHSLVFLLAPIFDVQPPRGREFQAFADGEEHNITPLKNRDLHPASDKN